MSLDLEAEKVHKFSKFADDASDGGLTKALSLAILKNPILLYILLKVEA